MAFTNAAHPERRRGMIEFSQGSFSGTYALRGLPEGFGISPAINELFTGRHESDRVGDRAKVSYGLQPSRR